MTKQLLLIDGDILIYRSACASEKEIEFEDDLWVLWSDLNDAKVIFKESMKAVTSAVPDAEPMLCLTDLKKNFRRDVDPTYKSNRKGVRKPLGFQDFREWVEAEYNCISKPTLEADDVMGILCTKPGNDAVIYSIDKDLMQIPGKHLVDGKIVIVTEEEGDRLHLMQTLTGDVVDGYPGCPGIGKVKAEKILNTLPVQWEEQGVVNQSRSMWLSVVDAYERSELTEQDALKQARLARILRWDDWDQQKQEVKLWVPKV